MPAPAPKKKTLEDYKRELFGEEDEETKKQREQIIARDNEVTAEVQHALVETSNERRQEKFEKNRAVRMIQDFGINNSDAYQMTDEMQKLVEKRE